MRFVARMLMLLTCSRADDAGICTQLDVLNVTRSLGRDYATIERTV